MWDGGEKCMRSRVLGKNQKNRGIRCKERTNLIPFDVY